MKNTKAITVVYSIISLLTMTILPSLLQPLVPIELLPLSALICCSCILVLIIILLLIKNNPKKIYQVIVDTTIPEYEKLTHIEKLRIYAITTSNIAAFFSQNNYTVNECTIILRAYKFDDAYFTDSYNSEIMSKINIWKSFVDNGRINRLTIIGCNNLPDHNFLIFDNTILAVGLNNFSSSDPSGQSVNLEPIWCVSKNQDNLIINRYIEHFDNYESYYKKDDNSIVYCDNYQRGDSV